MLYRFRAYKTPRLYVIGSYIALSTVLVVGGDAVLAQAPPATVAGADAGEAAIKTLDRAQIDALLATPDKILIIDVRRADEISSIGGFPAFLNIQNSELDRFLPFIPRDRAIITVSNHAHRGVQAGALLASKGFRIVGAAGVQDYEAQGGQLSGRTIVTPAIPGIVAAGTRVDVVREGFQGTEGPIALADGSILFTENRADRIVRIAPNGSVSTFLANTGSANALAARANGEIVAVQTSPPAVAILSPATKVLASRYRNAPFNRPNDLAASRTGNIYFTDPGAPPRAGAAAPTTAVYWLDRKGAVRSVATDIRRPNGVALSPDEKTLYVANTAGEALIAFTIKPDGSPTERRDFARLAGLKDTPNGPSSGADGVVVDAQGRVYVASNIGVQIFTPDGQPLGTIQLPNQPQNLAFGGPKRANLFVVGRGSVYRIPTLTTGVDRPGK